MTLDSIKVDDFKPLLNQQVFLEFVPPVQIAAELIELTELDGYSPLERKPFSTVFRTDQKTEYYQQGIYKLIHSALGDMSIFLTPQGFDGIGMKYEAVFS